MSILALPLGILLPTLSGWLGIRLLEYRTVVLGRAERIVAGFVLGLNGMMYFTFLAHVVLGVPLSLLGFLGVQIVVTGVLLGVYFFKRPHLGKIHHHKVHHATPHIWIRIALIALLVWSIMKLVVGSTFLIASPVYFDDVYKNWNLRGKIFYTEERLDLGIMQANGAIETGGVSSYPPAVPMIKAWLSQIAGSWNEGVINSVHILWYISAIALLYFALRRSLSLEWSLLGAYILSSLPLYLVHGSSAYADVYLSVHIFIAVSMLYCAIQTEKNDERSAYLRLGAFAAAILVFTKNEALLLHLPPLLLLLIVSVMYLRKKKMLSTKELRSAVLWYVVFIACTLLPWLIYKWSHGLTFGNAKGITGLTLGWQKGVLSSIWVNTFFEGNWNLLFPLLVGLFIACWKTALRTPLVICSAFFLIVYFGQYPLYLFTPLSTEAVMQTGYARGLIQLVPIAAMITTVLLAKLLARK